MVVSPPNSDWFSANQPAPAETPAEQQARFERDYWAPDREQVLANMRGSAAPPPGGTPPPGTPPPPGTSSSSSSSSTGTRQQFGAAWQAYAQTKPPNVTYVDWLKQFVAANPQYGATLGGSKGDKIYGPGGEFWADAIISSGLNGGTGAYWNESTGGGPGGGTNVGDFGSLAQGYDRQFQYPDINQTPFGAPSLEDARNSPGYQFQLETGVKALDEGAASRGTNPTSGPQQRALLSFATGLADSTYGNVYNRAANTFGINQNREQQNYENAVGRYSQDYTIFRNNQNDVFDRLDRVAARGTNAANSATS